MNLLLLLLIVKGRQNMKYLCSIFTLIFLLSGCMSAEERFPPGARVEVTQWELLQSSDGTQTLRGIVTNHSHYLIYDLVLVTQLIKEEEFKAELKTELKPLFPNTQTPFELILSPEIEGVVPQFFYQFQYTREEEFWDYRYNKKFGGRSSYFNPSFRAGYYRHPTRDYIDSKNLK